MNTSTNKNLLTVLSSVLLAPPFAIKLNDERVKLLETTIEDNTPKNRVETDTLIAWHKILATKFCLADQQNPNLIHIPTSQLYAGTKNPREVKPAHDFTVNLTTDTEYHLATQLLDLYYKQTNKETNKELHYPAYALECLHLINGLTTLIDLKGEKQLQTTSEAFNYEAIGLNPDWFHSGKGAVYTLPNNGGIRHIVKPEYVGKVLPLVFQRLDIFSMKTEPSTVGNYEGVMVYTKIIKEA